MRKYIDIGANLTDAVFRGIYRGKKVHDDDFQHVLNRAFGIGMDKIIVTAGCKDDINEALNLVKDNEKLYCTVGVHPTRCNEFENDGNPEGYLNMLKDFIVNNRDKVVAVGELGLDYDRTQFCPIEVQKKYFNIQLELATESNLPLFLHSRNCANDFIDIVSKKRDVLTGGVVHSFTGTSEEAEKYIELGFFIGINGCSLKTEENLKAMASIPTEKLMIETDAPWCGIRNTHAGSKFVKTKWDVKKKEKWTNGSTVKDRCEPCHIVQVLEVMAEYRDEDPDVLCNQIYENTTKLFFPDISGH